jgi:nitroreductase
MNISDAVRTRKSVRAFLDTPVSDAVLREVLTLAARAPSGGNVQPWRIYVLNGSAMADFKEVIRQRVAAQPEGEAPFPYDIYPPNLWEPHRGARFEVGENMYAAIGVARDDKAGRRRQFARNYEFFGAPAALLCFIDHRMGSAQWSDLGMYLQTVMLLLRERGLHSCAQECWSLYHQTIRQYLGTPPELMLFCGMAIGHEDTAAPINRLETRRLRFEDFATVVSAAVEETP